MIHRPELGALSVGHEADVAVIEEMRGKFSYADVRGAKLSGDRRLEARLTLKRGAIVYDPRGLSMPEWPEAAPEYFVTPDYSRWPKLPD